MMEMQTNKTRSLLTNIACEKEQRQWNMIETQRRTNAGPPWKHLRNFTLLKGEGSEQKHCELFARHLIEHKGITLC